MQTQIRTASERDLSSLNRDVKAAIGRTFEQELADQADGIHSLFLALDPKGAVLGSGFIHWAGPRDQQALALFPDAPEIFRLDVVARYRGQGIGTQLVSAMENSARGRRYSLVSLGVAHDNPRACRLYRQMGYEDTALSEYYDEYRYPAEDGSIRIARDLCRYLVKSL